MRLCRILRSPDPVTEGGASSDEFVTIRRAELADLKARADRDLSEPEPDRAELSETWKAREAAHSREIASRDRKATELERSYKAALLDRELATSLVGKTLVPGAAAQLIKLWRDDFEVIDEGGEIRVLSRDGRPVDQAVLDRLSGPDFAHFCLPSSRGGTGTRGQNRSSNPVAAPALPKTLGEAVLLQWRDSAARSQAEATPNGWGRRR